MTVVVVADLAIVTDFTFKIGLDQFLDISAASSQHLDTLSLKHILGSLPHIACQHHLHTHLSEYRCNSALASATFRRCHLAYTDNLIVNDIENCIICTMAEMVINTAIMNLMRNPFIGNRNIYAKIRNFAIFVKLKRLGYDHKI